MDWNHILLTLIGTSPAIIAAVAAFIQSLRNTRITKMASKKADEVKKELVKSNMETASTLGRIEDIANKDLTLTNEVHNLTNSSRTTLLHELAILQERLALLSGLPSDRLAADAATQRAFDHDEIQKMLNTKKE